MFSAVDDSKPNRITTAMGAWISLPGSPAAKASKTNLAGFEVLNEKA